MADPYKQGELEKLEGTIAKGGTRISQPVLWKGGLENILGVVRLLQHRCGFPEKAYQVKFNASANTLRLSDYTTRMACQPGEYFWLVGVNIRGGSMEDYEREKALVEEQDCPECGGSGFSGQGSGYGDVCGECGGQRRVSPDLS